MAKYDLLLRGGQVVDPSQGLDGNRDVAIKDGRIAAVAESLPVENAGAVIDVSGRIVTPGLVDLHTHCYWGVCEYGVEPDLHFLPRGTTTVLDVGSSGCVTFPAFRRFIIEPAKTRVFALLHVNITGMVHTVGELLSLRWVDAERTAAAAKEHSDLVVGIKVRLSRNVAGEADWEGFTAARKAADMAQLPLMVHFGDTHTPLSQILDAMGPGDIMTHCFTGRRNNILDENGRLLPAVTSAVKRGVLFDVGHGMGSFGFSTARAALEQGLVPTTISSDLHAYSQEYPVVDLPTTMTKFLHLGMSLYDAVDRVTAAPARVLGQAGVIGTLAPGAEADVTVLNLLDGEFRLWDSYKNSVVSPKLLSTAMTVRGGRFY